ncbi:MAG: NAD(+) synthase [Actinobacteria bacterium]|nr:NAD(+) synthase [Actinomycetota bacterium]
MVARRLARHLAGWLRREVEAGGGKGAVLGLSGGLDSAVAGALAKRAFPDETLGVLMPCHSDPSDAEDAMLVARYFDLETATVDLSTVHDALVAALEASSPRLGDHRLTTANLKPRLRMTTLYAHANLRGYRVIGAENLDELTIGYFTKYGDGGADFFLLGSLNKGEVRDLARELDVPRRIIDKPPSAGLWPGQTDEGEMGLTYEHLDAFVRGREVPAKVRARIEALRDAGAHKRAMPRIAPLPDEA